MRDGQETAGWIVGIWRESTMEKVTNYTVNSDPTDPTSDGDALTDFEEFMNGSDPRKLDTDGDTVPEGPSSSRAAGTRRLRASLIPPNLFVWCVGMHDREHGGIGTSSLGRGRACPP